MKLAIAAVVLALIAAVVVYVVLIRDGAPSQSGNQSRRACGSADLTAGADAEACRQYALDLVGRDAQRNIDAGRALLQKLCDQAYTQACKDLESFACLVLDIDEGRCSGAWFKPADGRSCVAVAQAIEAGECGRRNKAAHANDWYAKACALGVQSACGK